MLFDLVDVVCGFAIFLPRVGLRLPAVPRAIALVDGKIGGSAGLQSLCGLKDDVTPRFRLLNDIEDIVASYGIDDAVFDRVEDLSVVRGVTVDGVEADGL